MMENLSQINRIVLDIGATINAPREFLPTFGVPRGDGHPCIKIDGSYFVITYEERGTILDKKIVSSIDDLCYLIFDDVTYLMASHYEVNNRDMGQDPRIKLFKTQIEIMEKISDVFAKRLRSKINAILKESPYRKPMNPNNQT